MIETLRRARLDPHIVAVCFVLAPLLVVRAALGVHWGLHADYVAAAVADKDFTWAHATPAKYSDPRIARLMDLVEVDPAPPAVTYKWSWGGTVTIVTTAGARFTSTVDAPRGSGPRGIEWRDVDDKYRALMPDSKLPAARLGQILDQIHQFDRVNSVSAFARLLTPKG